jgi:hypothetical protein
MSMSERISAKISKNLEKGRARPSEATIPACGQKGESAGGKIKEIKEELSRFYEVAENNIKLLKRWRVYGHRLTTTCSFGCIGDHYHYDVLIKLVKPIVVEYCDAKHSWREDWFETQKLRG